MTAINIADERRKTSRIADRYMGILNLDKPLGVTSHDVVARVRRIAAQRSVGHAGTLDPLATGVLVVLLGRATALASYATAGTKVYAAELRLGEATTTDDREGPVCREASVPTVAVDEIDAILKERFTGVIAQVPPAFSAVKKDGQRAYVAARAGKGVELAPRMIVIHEIVVTKWESPRLDLRVTCGAGTYIRSLARDLGEALGSAAHLRGLVRTASGGFRLEDAIAMEALTSENVGERLLPADSAVAHLRSATMGTGSVARARHGGEIALGLAPASSDEVIRLYAEEGGFIGLARPAGDAWRPFRVLDPAS
jgi:tRNA pseudouridine55 synthase